MHSSNQFGVSQRMWQCDVTMFVASVRFTEGSSWKLTETRGNPEIWLVNPSRNWLPHSAWVNMTWKPISCSLPSCLSIDFWKNPPFVDDVPGNAMGFPHLLKKSGPCCQGNRWNRWKPKLKAKPNAKAMGRYWWEPMNTIVIECYRYTYIYISLSWIMNQSHWSCETIFCVRNIIRIWWDVHFRQLGCAL